MVWFINGIRTSNWKKVTSLCKTPNIMQNERDKQTKRTNLAFHSNNTFPMTIVRLDISPVLLEG